MSLTFALWLLRVDLRPLRLGFLYSLRTLLLALALLLFDPLRVPVAGFVRLHRLLPVLLALLL